MPGRSSPPCRVSSSPESLIAFSLACAAFGAAYAGSAATAPASDKTAAPQVAEYLIKNSPAGDTPSPG